MVPNVTQRVCLQTLSSLLAKELCSVYPPAPFHVAFLGLAPPAHSAHEQVSINPQSNTESLPLSLRAAHFPEDPDGDSPARSHHALSLKAPNTFNKHSLSPYFRSESRHDKAGCLSPPGQMLNVGQEKTSKEVPYHKVSLNTY